MNLTVEQERRLKSGDYRPLIFPFDLGDFPTHGKPVEPPFKLVLDWQESYRISDQLGNVTVVPREPVRWIVVTSVKRENRGDWVVRFELTDLREERRFLARGGGYTSSPVRAVDEAECVPKKYEQKLADTAYERDAALRLERAVAARQKWKRTRRAAQREARFFRSAA